MAEIIMQFTMTQSFITAQLLLLQETSNAASGCLASCYSTAETQATDTGHTDFLLYLHDM